MFKKILALTLVSFFFLTANSFAADLTLEDLMAKAQANQKQIKDMYAETETTMVSNMTMPGQASKGPQKMVQTGKMWTKGSDKSKIEMLSPTRQTTIRNGDKMAIINPETGQTMVQDLSKLKGPMAGQKADMTLEKALEYFNLSVKKSVSHYIVVGIPKENNKFMSKMEFYIEAERWLATKILMYGGDGKPLSQSTIEYEKISDVWVPIKNVSSVNTPMGKMDIEMVYKNIKVNEGIKDEVFKIK